MALIENEEEKGTTIQHLSGLSVKDLRSKKNKALADTADATEQAEEQIQVLEEQGLDEEDLDMDNVYREGQENILPQSILDRDVTELNESLKNMTTGTQQQRQVPARGAEGGQPEVRDDAARRQTDQEELLILSRAKKQQREDSLHQRHGGKLLRRRLKARPVSGVQGGGGILQHGRQAREGCSSSRSSEIIRTPLG